MYCIVISGGERGERLIEKKKIEFEILEGDVV